MAPCLLRASLESFHSPVLSTVQRLCRLVALGWGYTLSINITMHATAVLQCQEGDCRGSVGQLGLQNKKGHFYLKCLLKILTLWLLRSLDHFTLLIDLTDLGWFFCVAFACSLCACVGSPQELQPQLTVQKHTHHVN